MYRVKEKFHVNEVMTYQTVWQRIVTVLQYEHSYHIWANERVLVQRSSRLCAWMESVSNTPTSNYIFLLMTNLMHLFMYLFISSLYMFWASQCSSSGDRIVLIYHLVWLVCVSDCLVCRSGTGIPSSHLHRLIIPDDILIQFDLLMMSIVMLETFRERK